MKRILNQQHYGRLNEGWVKWVGWWGACSHVQGSQSLQVLVVERAVCIILIQARVTSTIP